MRQCSLFYLESSWWLIQLCVVQRQDEDSWMKNKVVKYDAQIRSYESREVKWCKHRIRWIERGTYAYLYRDRIVSTFSVIACAVCVQFVRRNSLVQNCQVLISIMNIIALSFISFFPTFSLLFVLHRFWNGIIQISSQQINILWNKTTVSKSILYFYLLF